MAEDNRFEVIIIGGSYAGLSAAMALGRSLRKVLIIDSGDPCNRQTPHTNNFITHDGEKPAAVSAKAKEEVLNYPTVKFLSDFAISAKKTDDGFEIGTRSGATFRATKLIIATGITDVMPDIKGFSECWGITAIHCPYCHGYEFRDQKTAVLGSGELTFHLATLVNNLTKDLTVLTNGTSNFDKDQRSSLQKNGLNIIDKEVGEVVHESGYLKKVRFKDGTALPFTALYTTLPFRQHSDIPASLGCEMTEHGHIRIDEFQMTSIEGVYACGDSTTMMRSVASAVFGGNITGAMVNKRLVDEQF